MSVRLTEKIGSIDHRGYFGVALHMPKDRHNVGAVLRTAHCYGAAFVGHTGTRYHRSMADTCASYRHIPLWRSEDDDIRRLIPYACVPVAVEIAEGAVSLPGYQHPERAVYVFGPEDGTLGHRSLELCRDRVFIPTRSCLNLAAAVATVLYDRQAKRGLVAGIDATRGLSAAIPAVRARPVVEVEHVE